MFYLAPLRWAQGKKLTPNESCSSDGFEKFWTITTALSREEKQIKVFKDAYLHASAFGAGEIATPDTIRFSVDAFSQPKNLDLNLSVYGEVRKINITDDPCLDFEPSWTLRLD